MQQELNRTDERLLRIWRL